MKTIYMHQGFSLVELLLVVVVIFVLASIAMPNLLASRRAANEASALAAVKKVGAAQTSYFATAGGGNYATAQQLFAHQLIGARLAAATNVNVGGNPARNTARDGYLYRLQITLAAPLLGTAPTFVISANPSSTSGITQTGSRRFCLTESGLLKASTQNIATKYNYAQCGFANPFVP